MWDLDTIIRRNNQVALEYMMRGRAVEAAQSVQPQTWSLSLLADKLRIGPPLLTEVLKSFTNIDTLENFLALIRCFLPEHEEEILSQAGGRRVYRFAYLFGKKYFPLPQYAFECRVEQIVNGLPIDLLAMSYSAYHDLEMRPGYLLLLSLVVYPYEGDERDQDEWWGDDEPKGKTLYEVFSGGRVPLLDAVQHIVGESLVSLIPGNGWLPSELHRMADGPHDGVGHFADWACSETGCVLLDTSYDDCPIQEGEGEPVFKWTTFNVQTLTKQWPKVQEIRQEIDRTAEWLETDPVRRFGELLELLKAKAVPKRKKTAKRGKRYYDPTDHWCPLDIECYDEEEDDDDDGEDEGGPEHRRVRYDELEAALQF